VSKVLVITGASKGIGLATAQHFLNCGYHVINLSRSSCELSGVVNLSIDLLNHNWAADNAAALAHAVGTPEQLVLVHNAAMMTKETISDINAGSLRDVLSIIYISSTLGRKAVANTHAYVVSKHAVIGQMRASCQDLVGTMIHTAAVCPGFTETKMLSEHLGANPEVYDQITATIAHGRLAQPSEIADTIWFVSQNPVINGTIIDANLGQIET